MRRIVRKARKQVTPAREREREREREKREKGEKGEVDDVLLSYR